MSHRHINKPKAPPKPIVWWKLGLLLVIFLASYATLLAFAHWGHSIPSKYETARGKILEMRKVVDGTIDSSYGGKILYGVEAHVQFTLKGQTQDRWLRVSGDMPRESLLLKSIGHPTECRVYWPPDQLEKARCWLDE
jgi:hypothetical protein